MGPNTPREGQQINEVLNGIKGLLPDTAESIEILFATLKDFETEDFYIHNPDEIANCDADIDEIAKEVLTEMRDESRKLNLENSQDVKDAFSELHTLLSARPNVYKYFLRGIFEHLGLTTRNLEMEGAETHVYKRFRVPNVLLSKTDLQRFLKALGLQWVPDSGKGEHEKWVDPSEEMSGFALASGGNKLWVKNIIKELLAKNVSLERIRVACEKRNIRFEEK